MKNRTKYLGLVLMLVMLVPAIPVATAQEECAYHEAPMLAEQVAAGTLPSVCERLPTNPVVIENGLLMPTDSLDLQVGKYSDQFVNAGAYLKEPLRGIEMFSGMLLGFCVMFETTVPLYELWLYKECECPAPAPAKEPAAAAPAPAPSTAPADSPAAEVSSD